MKIKLYLYLVFVSFIVVAEESNNRTSMNSRYGLLTVGERSEITFYKNLYINEKILPVQDYSVFLDEKWEFGNLDVILINKFSGGNLCPVMNQIILVEKNQVSVSDDFGNCLGPKTPVLKTKNGLILNFSRKNRHHPSMKVEYSNGKLFIPIMKNIDGKKVRKVEESKMEKVQFDSVFSIQNEVNERGVSFSAPSLTQTQSPLSPVLEPAPLTTAMSTIPSQFIGNWAPTEKCSMFAEYGAPDIGAVVTTTEVIRYENYCTLKSIDKAHEKHFSGLLTCSVEGETFVEQIKLVLDKNGELSINEAPPIPHCK